MDFNANRAGSLTLKSAIPMEYSRSVLSNKWYLKRESEPRDFDLWSGPKPNLQQSTYKILGKSLATDEILTDTETRVAHEEALALKQEEDSTKELVATKLMIDKTNQASIDAALNCYGNLKAATHMHKPGHRQHHLETTYNKDFVHPRPEMMHKKSEKMAQTEFINTVDNSWGYRRMVSQFGDIDGPKRAGINTWHIQHGEYPNQNLRHQLDARRSNNIFEMEYFNKT